MWPRFQIALLVLILLPSCAGDQHNSFDLDKAPRTRSEPVIEDAHAETVELPARPIPSEIRSSENNTQQNQTAGLANVAVAKLAENVDASLLKFQTEVRNELSASLKASADVRAELQSEIQLRIKLQADMQAMATAQAQGIAGIGNRLDSVTQTISSGRDTNNTQFTPQMAETLMSNQRQQVIALVVLIISVTAIVIVYMEVRHRRGKVL